MEAKMGRKKVYEVTLSQAEHDHLKNLVSTGVAKARHLTHARILLKASEGWTDEQIREALDVGQATVGRIRKRYAEEGLEGALHRRPPRRQYARKIDGQTEAHLIALVCGEAPAGYARWSLRLLSERLVTLEAVEIESVSHETVRQTLKKTNLNLGRINSG
jgi:transposase